MSHVSYNTCDSCGLKDDPIAKVFHLALTDLNGCAIGHLCVGCARSAAPLADWSPFDRSA